MTGRCSPHAGQAGAAAAVAVAAAVPSRDLARGCTTSFDYSARSTTPYYG